MVAEKAIRAVYSRPSTGLPRVPKVSPFRLRAVCHVCDRGIQKLPDTGRSSSLDVPEPRSPQGFDGPETARHSDCHAVLE